MLQIDLNCDLAEGCGSDDLLMPRITTANIACGFHAGNALLAFDSIREATKHDVRVGAHPGYADPAHFGRRDLNLSEEQLFAELVYQIGALRAIAQVLGVSLSHVKPHGAMYNQACRDHSIARPIVAAAQHFHLPVFGLPKSQLESCCTNRVRFIREGFADRRYRSDGSLMPRSEPNAMLSDPLEAVNQARNLIAQGIETLCVHGDTPEALAFLISLHAELNRSGITVRACS